MKPIFISGMDLSFEPIRIANHDTTEAMLVFRGKAVVAIVSRLSDEHGEQFSGRYYVECAFGEAPEHQVFSELADLKLALERGLRDES